MWHNPGPWIWGGCLLGWDGSSWKDFLSLEKGRQSLCCSPGFCCIWIETLELQQHSFLGLQLKPEPGYWVLHHGICINQSILQLFYFQTFFFLIHFLISLRATWLSNSTTTTKLSQMKHPLQAACHEDLSCHSGLCSADASPTERETERWPVIYPTPAPKTPVREWHCRTSWITYPNVNVFAKSWLLRMWNVNKMMALKGACPL